MKKLLLPLLITSMFVNAKQTTGVGEYRYGPDTSQDVACQIAEERARENAVTKVVGESFEFFTSEHCKNEKCESQKETFREVNGYIQSILSNEKQITKEEGYTNCMSIIKANVELYNEDIALKLYTPHFHLNEEDSLIIRGIVNKPGFITIYNLYNGSYTKIYSEKIINANKEFAIPSGMNKIVAKLSIDEKDSKEVIMVLFTEEFVNSKNKLTTIEMNEFVNELPKHKHRVIKKQLYIMKKGNIL